MRLWWFLFIQLEEELFRARYILSEGDAAAFLPSKAHGIAIAFFLVFAVLRSAFEDVLLICSVYLEFLAGRFLRMFLGPINVRANRKDVQLKVKEEYNGFRVCIETKTCIFFNSIYYFLCMSLF